MRRQQGQQAACHQIGIVCAVKILRQEDMTAHLSAQQCFHAAHIILDDAVTAGSEMRHTTVLTHHVEQDLTAQHLTHNCCVGVARQ